MEAEGVVRDGNSQCCSCRQLGMERAGVRDPGSVYYYSLLEVWTNGLSFASLVEQRGQKCS